MNIKGAGRKPKEEEDRKGKNLKIRLSVDIPEKLSHLLFYQPV